MLKILRYEYIIFLMLLPFISIAEAEVIYNKKEGRLSVDVVNTPLTDVLRVISEKTGIIIKMDSGVDNSVTVGFNNLPVEEGIREIIRPNSYAMTFKKEVMENGRKDYFVETIYVLREGASGIANAALNGAQMAPGSSAAFSPKRSGGENIEIAVYDKTTVSNMPSPSSGQWLKSDISIKSEREK